MSRRKQGKRPCNSDSASQSSAAGAACVLVFQVADAGGGNFRHSENPSSEKKNARELIGQTPVKSASLGGDFLARMYIEREHEFLALKRTQAGYIALAKDDGNCNVNSFRK